MQSNHIGNAILGTIHHGQAIVVDATHRALCVLFDKLALRLALRLDGWRAVMCMASAPRAAMAMATCSSYSARCPQRRQRWVPVVVETRGTVGVC